MPAKKQRAQRYYSAKDVQTILHCSKGKANDILHRFEGTGALIRIDNMLRVRMDAFDKWLESQTLTV